MIQSHLLLLLPLPLLLLLLPLLSLQPPLSLLLLPLLDNMVRCARTVSSYTCRSKKKKNKKMEPTAPGIPMWSPTIVLTWPARA